MNDRLEAQLVVEFPTLYQNRFGDKMTTGMCWGFQCNDGWFDIIWQLSAILEPLCVAEFAKLTQEQKDAGMLFCATQVKEKYGTLRFYMNYETEEMALAVQEAEEKSATTCEECGQKGECREHNHWFVTQCDKCWARYQLTH